MAFVFLPYCKNLLCTTEMRHCGIGCDTETKGVHGFVVLNNSRFDDRDSRHATVYGLWL